ncbi:MAG: hypothetical protein RLY86_665 [Pseudomonadota bacterium]|jgi:hypothetical protein
MTQRAPVRVFQPLPDLIGRTHPVDGGMAMATCHAAYVTYGDTVLVCTLSTGELHLEVRAAEVLHDPVEVTSTARAVIACGRSGLTAAQDRRVLALALAALAQCYADGLMLGPIQWEPWPEVTRPPAHPVQP